MKQAFIQKLTEIVEQNLDNEQFGVEDLASGAGVSRSQLHRKLKKLTGQSSSQFIREIRLEHAMELLKAEVATASEIAYRVGFSSPAYFGKCFHDYYGFPPGEAVHYKPEDEVSSYPVDTDSTQTKGENTILVYSAKVLLILMVVIGGYFYFQNGQGKESGAETSIAVLPLDNLTGDEEQAFFVDGLHDALIGELGQLSELRVISRTSTLQFRNAELNIRDIAKQLGVENVIEGSLYRAEDSVRIQIQLIQAGPEEQHLWAKSYDRNTENILSLLSDVTRDIAQSVQVTLTPEEDSLLANRREVNPEAYKAYLRGTYLLNQFTPESHKKGISYLLEATRIDPADPLPWARLALGYNTSGHGITPPADAYELAQAAAERALKLDNSLGEVHLAHTVVDLYNDWDWDAASRGFKRTIKFDPNIAETYAHYSWFVMLEGGSPDDILQQSRLAMKLDPFTALYPVYLGFQAWWLGMYDEAIAAAKKSLELNPGYPYGFYVLGSAYAADENYEEAIKAHERAVELNPRWKFGLGHTYAVAGMTDKALEIANELSSNPTPIGNWGLAEIYAALGDKDEALRWLEACYESRFSWMPWIEWNPNFEPLYDNPHFQDLLGRMNVRSRSTLFSNF
ncbi:helix-turn-helix domain-containing protein [Aliifodinibius sp. S!AR15-10]|nr:helix-turn-helix domain-containing protein [Aliifodinibius sp. S!AR15-10]